MRFTASGVAGFMMLAGASALLMICVLALLLVLDGDLGGAQTRIATYLLVGGAGGFAGAAMASIYAMMAHGYPVACRSGGLGFGMMLGRAGGIVASFATTTIRLSREFVRHHSP